MPILDTADFAGGEGLPPALDCDVCIVGTGPAGSTIARELSGSGLRVTVLESGGFERSAQVDELNEVDSLGWPRVADQWLVRNRVVGGSSTTWSGRCAPFDDIDFEARPWVPWSGWPLDPVALTPYLDRAAPYLGLNPGSGFNDDRFWALSGHRKPDRAADPDKLLPMFWQSSRDSSNPYDSMRFGRHLVPNLGSNVTVVTNATVCRVHVVESGAAVRSVEFAAADGRRWTLAASTVVVCAGGIENARLLLCSDDVASAGVGNDHDLVGRFLMDHPRGTVARFELSQGRALFKRFGIYRARSTGGHSFLHGVRLSPTIQRAEQLLNCSAWVEEDVTPDDPWSALTRLLRGRPEGLHDVVSIASNAGLFARGLSRYFIRQRGLPRKMDALGLTGMCEQLPDPDSRITLSDRRDRLGMRVPHVDWRMHPEDARTMRRIAELAVEQFPRMGLPAPVPEEWVRDGGMLPPSFTDVAHPTGTTRMAADPAHGVVDTDCQVHGVRGLFVAGSSVFPTSGHSNPTLTIVALALRLADTLKTGTGR